MRSSRPLLHALAFLLLGLLPAVAAAPDPVSYEDFQQLQGFSDDGEITRLPDEAIAGREAELPDRLFSESALATGR